MRMRKKRKLTSRIDYCEYLLVKKPEDFRSLWLEKFTYNELHIELGCGRGLFTAEAAKNDPDVLIVALEKITNVLVIAMERAKRESIPNIRFINRAADDLTEFFGENEASRIYLNFCDPWPARRHEKRRLTGQRFLDLYKNVMTPNGEIHFKTDNIQLFEYSLKEFEKCSFKLSEISYNLHEYGIAGVMTDYEKKFHDRGMPIYRCVAGSS